MTPRLLPLFDALIAPAPLVQGAPRFAAAPLAGYPAWFVSKDSEGKACLLAQSASPEQRHQAPIRLEAIDATFGVPSVIHAGGRDTLGSFAIIRCRSADREVNVYFLSVCESILQLLGASSDHAAIANAVNQIAFIFRKLQQSPARSINGLFGELFVIRQSRNPCAALAAWRVDHVSRFDFSAGDARLDVKTAAGRSRVHYFSFDQCNPPAGTVALAASLFVERSAAGVSLREMIQHIEQHCAASPDSLIRLHNVVAETLGTALLEALALRFDQRLSEATLAFYDLREIPAIRAAAPPGVTDIHFRSDLSLARPAALEQLTRYCPPVADFMPGPP